jgi:hypothetical protein
MFIIHILITSSLIAAGDFQIQDVLPSETILACSIDDLNHVCESLITDEQSENIYAVMQSVMGEESYAEMCAVITEQSKEMIAKAGLEDDWKPQVPAGDMGFGVYPVADFEAGTIGIAMLAILEFKDPAMTQLMRFMFDNMLDEMDVEVEVVNLSGEDVWMIDSFVDSALLQEVPMGVGNSLSIDRFYITSVNGYLICGTEPDGVSNAIDASNGKLESARTSLATNKTYTAMIDQIGEGDLHAVVMMENLADFIIQSDQSRMIGMFLPMLKSAIGDVQGFAENVTFSSDQDVYLNSSYTIWMPNGRDGLSGIASPMPSPTSTPNFVAEDTVSYSQVNVDFAKLAPWFKDVMGMNPMMPVSSQELDEMEQAVTAAVTPLGSTMHVVSSMSMPITENSMGFLLAVECKDSEAMETYLSSTMPMTGSEPREFLGYRIYPIELPDIGMMGGGMDVSLSLAVGGGWAMLGMTNSVENALRLSANPDAHENSAPKNTALSFMTKKNATGWGYVDMGESIQASAELSQIQMTNMIAEMETFDPEMAAEMKEQFESQMDSSKTMNELLASLLGPSAWRMEAHDEGFLADAVLMRP